MYSPTPRNALALLFLASLFAVGCLRPAPPLPPPAVAPGGVTTPPPAADIGKIKLMLNWYPEAEHGGYYAALLHGFYKEAGLDVEIVPGGPNAPVVPQTARGGVQFGVTNADRILLARSEGANVQALMAPLQNSPRCVLVHEESGIESLTDLKDVTLMMRRENAWAQFLLTKLDADKVTVAPNTASLAPFLKDPRAAKQGYIISEPFVAKREGAKVRALQVSDIGFNPYTSILMTSDSFAEANPDVTARIVAASIRGWRKYLESPDETNAYIHSLNPEMSEDVLQFGVDAIKQHCLGEPADGPFGAMTLDRWKTLVEQLESLQMLEPNAVPPESAFTSQFMPAKEP